MESVNCPPVQVTCAVSTGAFPTLLSAMMMESTRR
jgi:hypothetical protein